MVTTNSSLPEGDHIDVPAVEHWLDMLPDEFNDDDRDYLRIASEIALSAHPERHILNGESQLRHALSVAEILGPPAHGSGDSRFCDAVGGAEGPWHHSEEAGEPARSEYREHGG